MQSNNIFCKILNVNRAILALIKKSESDLITLLNVPAEFSVRHLYGGIRSTKPILLF